MRKHEAYHRGKPMEINLSMGDHIQLLNREQRKLEILIVLYVRTWSTHMLRSGDLVIWCLQRDDNTQVGYLQSEKNTCICYLENEKDT